MSVADKVFSLILVLAAALHSCQAAAAQDIKHIRLPDTDANLPGAGPIRRYDWFRNLWEERRTRFSKQQQADRNAVVFLGDSITQGANDDFLGLFPGLKIANRGISGDTTRGMLLRLEDDVLTVEPKAIVILAGTNDLEEGAAPDVIAANVQLILAQIAKGRPETPVVLCLVFPSSASKKRPAESIK
ncbi:MAG: hypothetical protein RLZZ458_667, partial [Planctomycetota bacterium]